MLIFLLFLFLLATQVWRITSIIIIITTILIDMIVINIIIIITIIIAILYIYIYIYIYTWRGIAPSLTDDPRRESLVYGPV